MFNKLKRTKYRLAIITLAALYLTTLLTIQYKQQTIAEPLKMLPQVDEQVHRLASTVEVGIYINSFPEFSFTRQLFVMDAFLWFKFPQSTAMLDTLENFTFQKNLLTGPKLIHKSAPIVKIVGDDVLVSYHILVTYKTDQIFHQFPLSGHRLVFVLENKTVTAREINFISAPENLVLSPNVSIDMWVYDATYAQGGYISSSLNPSNPVMNIDYPGVVFAIDFTGIGARDLFSLYFPLFVIFFISLLGLIIDVFNFTGLGIIASSVPMLVLFRLVIQGESPEIAYMTHIDFTFYTLIFFSLLILFIASYIVLEAQWSKDIPDEAERNRVKEKLEKISNSAFFIMPILLMIFMTIGFFK